jgi:predicted HAD superfamily hydrolase
MNKTTLSNRFTLYFSSMLLATLLFSCVYHKPDQLFYKKAEILDIRRDDESQYHILLKYEDGTVQSVADVGANIKMGNYKPTAEMPFVNYENHLSKGTLSAWRVNTTDYSSVKIKVWLPLNYNIKLFVD